LQFWLVDWLLECLIFGLVLIQTIWHISALRLPFTLNLEYDLNYNTLRAYVNLNDPYAQVHDTGEGAASQVDDEKSSVSAVSQQGLEITSKL
jgi:hypothetical protein